MLTKPMRKYLSSENRRGFNKSAYNSRLRDYSTRALRDLTLVAKKASDEDLSDSIGEIFTAENLTPLIRAIVSKHPSREENFGIAKMLIEEGHGGITNIGSKVLPYGLLNLYVNEFWKTHSIWVHAVGYFVKKAEEKPGVKKPSEKVHRSARA